MLSLLHSPRKNTTTNIIIPVLFLFFFHLVASQSPSSCQQIGPAVIRGRQFYDSITGRPIPLRGINYYPRPNAGPLDTNGVDFFTDDLQHIWGPDIPHLKALGVNVIRIFAVDPSKSHDLFMCALKAAGIYVVVGLAAPCDGCGIDARPAPTCYPASVKKRGQFVINTFSRYDNTLAFSAGNEPNLEAALSEGEIPFEQNAPCQKRFIQDMRTFIRNCNTLRKIPVGLSLADIYRRDNALYYACQYNGQDEDDATSAARTTSNADPNAEMQSADFYALNVYQHCNAADEEIIGFRRLQTDFASFNLDIPVMLTEFGCVNPSFPTIDNFEGQRDFRQASLLFGDADFRQEFAGAFAYEFSTERWDAAIANSEYPFYRWGYGNYGVGYYSPADCNHMDIPCVYTRFPQFDTLAQRFREPLAEYTEDMDRTSPTCPSRFGPSLSTYTWPSDSAPDDGCAWWPDPLICPNTPPECLPPTPSPMAPTNAPTKFPTEAPVVTTTEAPIAATTEAPVATTTEAPIAATEAPVATTTEAPVVTTAIAPVKAPTIPLPPGSPGFPTCFVCGAGNKVGNPTAQVEFPTLTQLVSCDDLQEGGLAGFVDPLVCPMIPDLIGDCQCILGQATRRPLSQTPVAILGLPTLAPAVSAAPVVPQTDVTTTEAPVVASDPQQAATEAPVVPQPQTEAPVVPEPQTDSPVAPLPATDAPVAPEPQTESPVAPTGSPVSPTPAPTEAPTDMPIASTGAPVISRDVPLSVAPSSAPSASPTARPTTMPTTTPTTMPTTTPSSTPTSSPTDQPVFLPTVDLRPSFATSQIQGGISTASRFTIGGSALLAMISMLIFVVM